MTNENKYNGHFITQSEDIEKSNLKETQDKIGNFFDVNCNREQLSATHKNPKIFVISQWQTDESPNYFYLIYKWAAALFLLVILCIDIEKTADDIDDKLVYRMKWLIFVDHWGLILCTLDFWIAAIMISICFMAASNPNPTNKQIEETTLSFHPFYWIIFTIATDVTFGITSIDWFLIYDLKTHECCMHYITHIGSALLILLDFFLVSHPVQLLHFVYPITFGITYLIFSVIYYIVNGTSRHGDDYIYLVLQWNNPRLSIIVCLVGIFLLLIIHICTWGLWIYRVKLHETLINNKSTTYKKSKIVETPN